MSVETTTVFVLVYLLVALAVGALVVAVLITQLKKNLLAIKWYKTQNLEQVEHPETSKRDSVLGVNGVTSFAE
ncbi:hypothetical protein [Rothia sp. P7208]|uniref:hypothetical protein n=1 Tax=Rothia sp. P7208 TaxID=3402660 RepID=UPI003AD38E26